MKGIILAGGTGSSLYPLQTLIDAGLDEIMIVSGRGHAGDFLELLGARARSLACISPMRYRKRLAALRRLSVWQRILQMTMMSQ